MVELLFGSRYFGIRILLVISQGLKPARVVFRKVRLLKELNKIAKMQKSPACLHADPLLDDAAAEH
jgi:hypothetical protein